VADGFLQYAETLEERGTEVDVSVTGNDLLVRARMLQKMPFTDTDGQMYRVPGVSFTPWYDLHELLDNHDDNVVGRITSVPKSLGNSCSSGSSRNTVVVTVVVVVVVEVVILVVVVSVWGCGASPLKVFFSI